MVNYYYYSKYRCNRLNLKILHRHPVSAVLKLQKVVQSTSTMNRIYLWGLHIQAVKFPLMPCVSCTIKHYQTVLRYVPNFTDIMILIALNLRTKILVSFKHKCEALQSCQSRMVKRSKTDTENVRGLLQRELAHCTCRRSPYTCRNPN
jgi:hypothetical protein